MVKDGIPKTPAANGCFLSGLTRRRIIELLAEEGTEVEETAVTLDDLLDADEVFLTGNYSKVLPVTRVADRNYQVGKVATQARELYMDFASREGKRQAG